jgi:(p)ppGpp synthase/HD superfamily hydrolase
MTEKLMPNWQPTAILLDAFEIAAEQHKDGVRKGTTIPYISHLLAVSALVIEHGGTEVQAGAALLHDVIEDTDLKDTFLLGALAGPEIAKIVIACTDSFKEEKLPWRERKENYIVHLREMIAEPVTNAAILVALADKVHNAETTANLVLLEGLTAKQIFVSPPFNAGVDEQKWWYTSLVAEFSKSTVAPKLVERLDRAVKVIFK